MGKRRRGGQRSGNARVEISAGGVIFRWQGDAPHVLLIRDRYQHWGFPKGHLEGEETPADAALREVREETGLADLVLGPALQTIDWFFRFRGRLIHKYCHFYLIEAPTGDTSPQEDEGITECVWLPLAEAIEVISYDNAREVLRAAAEQLEAVGSRGRVGSGVSS
ncbi:MAG TPA: NUDIX hydrolase [Longimicrobiaceae bacterium]|nr:NUDIX hydrolase [Longimicrobiaceae bacterium]